MSFLDRKLGNESDVLADEQFQNITYTDTPFEQNFLPQLDMFLGTICVLCVIIGVPGNILSLWYFHHKIRVGKGRGSADFFGYLYLAISLTDLIICVTIIPVTEAFINGRNSVMFEQNSFCTIWGLVWEIIPFYSVFLVGVLSISRLITLFQPHRMLSTTLLVWWLASYLTALVLSKAVPLMMKFSNVKYFKNTMYCFLLPIPDSVYWAFSIASSIVLLAAPILPILITCLTLIYKLTSTHLPISTQYNQKRRGALSRQTRATKTIIIVTLVYISYNIPVFLKFVHHLQYVIRNTQDIQYDYKKAYDSVVLYWYGWVFTYTVCVVMNSATNPVVYLCRMKGFNNFVSELFFLRRRISMQHSVTSIRNGAVVTQF